MRWEELFADMEAQLAHAGQRNAELEAVETARAELSQLALVQRLAAQKGAHVRVKVGHGDVIEGEISDLGAGWVALRDGAVQHVIPLHQAVWWEGLSRRFASDFENTVLRRLGVGHVIRALSQSRARVRIHLVSQTPGAEVEGTIDTVGQDFLDVALHPDDQYRRGRTVTGIRTVGFSAISMISSADAG